MLLSVVIIEQKIGSQVKYNLYKVLCWKFPESNSCIWRSSQCKPGITQQRSYGDEFFLEKISDFTNKIYIYDARPYLNAFANKFKGAGYENTQHYKNCELVFCGIENIHKVRASLDKMFAICETNNIQENKKYYSLLEQAGWMDFIQNIIKSSLSVVNSLKEGNTVLIHCSDGWDRTSQLSSLAQLFLDPYYRTIEGFIVLIEKEWISFGHQFALRNGINCCTSFNDEFSPIFLQWLDCIHQAIYQFPSAFEFNVDLLVYLADNLYSCVYGSFMFNNEKERCDAQAKSKTLSIWSDMDFEKFKNPFYEIKTSRKHIREITLNYSFHKLRVWDEYFFRWFKNNDSHFKLSGISPKQSNNDTYNKFDFIKKDSNEISNRYEKMENEFSESLIIQPNEFAFESNNMKFYENIRKMDLEIIDTNRRNIDSITRIAKEIGYNLPTNNDENEKEDFTVIKYGFNGTKYAKQNEVKVINIEEINNKNKINERFMTQNIYPNPKESIYVVDERNQRNFNNKSLEILENYIP